MLVLTVMLAIIAFVVPAASGWIGFRLGVTRLDEEGAGD
jgi:hypothetical protein